MPEDAERPKRAPREKVAVRLSDAGIAEIDALAETEHRTRSDMIRVLLIEAVAARRRATDDAPAQRTAWKLPPKKGKP